MQQRLAIWIKIISSRCKEKLGSWYELIDLGIEISGAGQEKQD